MTVLSYAIGLTSLLAGALFFIKPDVLTETRYWWGDKMPEWMQPPLSVFTPSVRLVIGHTLTKGAGFHRRYRLHVKLSQTGEEPLDLTTCRITADWRFSKDILIDQWMLHRQEGQGLIKWEVGNTVVDLEAPSYSPEAKPFSLRATRPLGRATEIIMDIPQLTFRYQMPLEKRSRSSKITITPPKVALECDSYVSFTTFTDQASRALHVTMPVAPPSVLINSATYLIVVLSLIHILYQLYKS